MKLKVVQKERRQQKKWLGFCKIYLYKYKYKYFIGTNTITIIVKGPKWSYNRKHNNMTLHMYYEYWIISFLRVRQLLM